MWVCVGGCQCLHLLSDVIDPSRSNNFMASPISCFTYHWVFNRSALLLPSSLNKNVFLLVDERKLMMCSNLI